MIRYLVTFFVLTVGAIVLVQPVAACANPGFNFECQRQKFIDPAANCDLNCLDNTTVDYVSGEFFRLNLFGTTFRFDSSKAIGQIISLGFSVFFGVIALVATALGFVSAIKRANVESDADVEKATKTMRNAITGVVIAAMAILIIQLVSGLFGFSIFQLADFNSFILPGGE